MSRPAPRGALTIPARSAPRRVPLESGMRHHDPRSVTPGIAPATGSRWGRGLRAMACALALALLPASAALAAHEVRLPNGEFVETHEDLRIQVRGGAIVVQRTWQADDVTTGTYRWHLNPAWDNLRFEYDPFDGSIQEIRRAGSRFERSGDAFVFDGRFVIRREGEGWRWTSREGDWIRYDAEGGILAWGDANLEVARFVRDPNGRLLHIQDHRGETQLSWTWDGNRVVALRDRTGREVRYAWNGIHLREVTDVLGNTWRYGYTGNLLSSLTDPEGGERVVAYQGTRVARVTDEEGHATTWTYDYDRAARRYSVVQRSPEGVRVERRYDVKGRLAGLDVGQRTALTVTRDGDHVAVRTDSRGLRTRVEYDAQRNPVLVRHPDGSEQRMAYEPVFNRLVEQVDEAGVITRMRYDGRGNMVELVEAAGLPEQRTTVFTWSGAGELLTRTVKGATPAEDATTTWTWDAYGNPLTETNPLGETTRYTSNVQGLTLTATNAEGETTTWEYDAAGQLQVERSPLGHETRAAWDRAHRLVSVTDPLGNAATLEHDAVGRLVATVDPEGGRTAWTLDEDGRVVAETGPEGATQAYAYDAEGRLSTFTDASGYATRLHYGTAAQGLEGLLARVELPTFQVEYRYDPRGRMTQVQRALPDPDGGDARIETTQSVYDARGLLVARIDPLGRRTGWAFDGLRRLVLQTDAMGGETRYAYDARDNLLSLRDALGATHRFVHDLADRQREEHRPLGGVLRSRYDRAGRLVERIAAGGERRAYTWNRDARLVAEAHTPALADDASQWIEYAYDDAGRLSGYVQRGDTLSRASYTLDGRGQRLREDVVYGEGADEIAFSIGARYRATGQTAARVYPGGVEVEHAYGADGRIARQGLPGGGEIAYDAWGWLAPTRMRGPGITREVTLDALQRPTRIHVQGAAGTVMDERYTWDAVGNLRARGTVDGEFRYEYDALDRLTAALPPVNLQTGEHALPEERYGYDAVHNRIASQHQPGSWTYDADHRLQAWGSGALREVMTHDANGQTVTREIGGQRVGYAYDAGERLREVTRNGVVAARYQYDPFGRRIAKEVGGQVTWFAYGEEGLLAELDASGAARVLYGWSPDTFWGTAATSRADRSGAGWAVSVLHPDHLGTPRHATDASGQVNWTARIEAFGRVAGTPVAAIPQPLRFPGQYADAETGLHDNYFRSYEPALGRYLQADPLSLAAGVNLYAYVGGRPTVFGDPLGLVYGDGVLQVEDVFFGPTYWLREQFGLDPSLPQGLVDFSAGWGDSLTMNATSGLRDMMGVDGGVDKCSGFYTAGQVGGTVHSAFVPIGRIGYVAQAARIPRMGVSAEAAVAIRNELKDYYRGPLAGVLRNWHAVTYAGLLEKNLTAAEIIAGAGRTSKPWSAGIIGVGSAATGARAADVGDGCECQ